MLLLWLACADPFSARAELGDGEVLVTASRPVDAVWATRDGAPLPAATLRAPTDLVGLGLPDDEGGTWTIFARSGAEVATTSLVVPPTAPVRVRVDAPLGQGLESVVSGEVVPARCAVGASFDALVQVETLGETPQLRVNGAPVDAQVRGQRLSYVTRLPCGASVAFAASAGADAVGWSLAPRPATREALAAALSLTAVVFPSDAEGAVDPSVAADRITLAPPALQALVARLGLRVRPRDDLAPWGFVGTTLHNPTDTSAVAMLRVRVEAEGAPAPAFKPHLRGAAAGIPDVVARVRVPAGGSVDAALPVWVDDALVEPRSYDLVVDVLAPGLDAPLHTARRPVWVGRTASAVVIGFALSIVGSLAGGAVMLTFGRRFILASRTIELATVGSFCAATFVVATASQVAALGVGALLGPFTPLVFGLFDDTFRTVLLAGLVALVPRPGVVALATLVGWILRGLALGSLHPLDLLYLGSATFWLEACLWMSGVSTGAWLRDPPWRQRLRLGFGFGVGQLVTAALGLATSAVLYRLHWSSAYVAAMIGLPGFLYVLLAVEPARRFAHGLRQSAR
jgi:hypothetical protein